MEMSKLDIYSFGQALITSRFLKKACYTPLLVNVSSNNVMDVPDRCNARRPEAANACMGIA